MISVEEKLIPINKRFANEYHLVDALKELGNPEKDIPTINVVGTNGKGSISFYTSLGLRHKFKKIGLFISPAFLYQNERIQINNEYISDKDLKDYLKQIDGLIKKYNLTFFEIWTLIMILYFRDQQVDIAVVEAGIGGMKDSTNLMSNQVATLLGAVGLDHMDVLGDTVEKIIYQKVNITKPGTTLYVSADDEQYEQTIKDSLINKDVKVVMADRIEDDIEYQQANKGLVVTFLEQEFGITNFSFLNTKPPLGRFTILSNDPLVVIDGAHNENGIKGFIKSYQDAYPDKKPLILYASAYNKDYKGNLDKLEKAFGEDNIYITSFDHFKSWDINEINFKHKVSDWKQWLKDNIYKHQDIIVIGSLYFIPMVYQWYKENL